jgi:hypothetical protein
MTFSSRLVSGVALLFTVLATFLLSSCYFGPHINGSGHVVKKEYRASSFDKIDLSLIFNTVIIPSNEEKIIVETDDNLQQYVLIESEHGVLTVKMQSNINIGHKSAGTVYIYFKQLVSLDNSSVGKLSNVDTLKAGNFNLINSAVGNVELKFKTHTLTISNSAVGKTELYIHTDTLSLNNSAVGKTELRGSCVLANMDNSGVGYFGALDFTTQVLHLENSAVGKTDVRAEKEFYINNSSVGKLDMYGNGVIKQLNDSGISKSSKH